MSEQPGSKIFIIDLYLEGPEHPLDILNYLICLSILYQALSDIYHIVSSLFIDSGDYLAFFCTRKGSIHLMSVMIRLLHAKKLDPARFDTHKLLTDKLLKAAVYLISLFLKIAVIFLSDLCAATAFFTVFTRYFFHAYLHFCIWVSLNMIDSFEHYFRITFYSKSPAQTPVRSKAGMKLSSAVSPTCIKPFVTPSSAA